MNQCKRVRVVRGVAFTDGNPELVFYQEEPFFLGGFVIDDEDAETIERYMAIYRGEWDFPTVVGKINAGVAVTDIVKTLLGTRLSNPYVAWITYLDIERTGFCIHIRDYTNEGPPVHYKLNLRKVG